MASKISISEADTQSCAKLTETYDRRTSSTSVQSLWRVASVLRVLAILCPGMRSLREFRHDGGAKLQSYSLHFCKPAGLHRFRGGRLSFIAKTLYRDLGGLKRPQSRRSSAI